MNKAYICLLILAISTTSFAQKAIKLNAHLQYKAYDYSSAINDSIYFQETNSNLNVSPAPTYSIYTKKNSFHEIGLSHLQFRIEDNLQANIYPTFTNPIQGAKTTIFNIGFRYDYNYNLTKNESPFLAYLGFSSSLEYASKLNEPKISLSYKRNQYKLGANIGIVPRLVWKLNSVIFIDLNIPINIFRVEYSHQRIHNPSLPVEQQKNGGLETTFLPKNYEVRLGVGVFLFKGDKGN